MVGKVFLPGGDLDLRVACRRAATSSHREALPEMRRASALLLYVAPFEPRAVGKLYEYLASERPILCVARPDGLALPARARAGGRRRPPTRATARRIERAHARPLPALGAGPPGAPPGVRERALERYSRRALTGELARVLDRVAG